MGNHIQQQEDANWDACREAFIEAHPQRPTFLHHSCDEGEWDCKGCPFKYREPEAEDTDLHDILDPSLPSHR